MAPDITGRFISDAQVCVSSGKDVEIKGVVCNRGTKAVASRMSAVFYSGDVGGEILCVSYTETNVPVGGCKEVSCKIDEVKAKSLKGKISMLVNDNGKGVQTTVECNYDNNKDTIEITGCSIN